MRSIKLKLNLCFVLIVTLMLGVFGVYDFVQKRKVLKEQFADSTAAIVQRLSDNLPTALWNFDETTIEKVVLSEMSVEGVVAIAAWSADQLAFGSMRTADGEIAILDEVPESLGDPVSYPLTFMEDGTANEVGSISLFTSDEHIQTALRQQIFQLLIEIAVLDLVLVLSISWILSWFVLNRLSKVVAAIQDIAQGEGDLTRRIVDDSKDEIGQLCQSFNAVIKKLQVVMREVATGVECLTATAEQTSAITDKTTSDVKTQQAETSRVIDAICKMSGNIEEVASSTARTAKAAISAQNEAKEGSDLLGTTLDAIGQLSSSVDGAGDVIERVVQDSNNISTILDAIQSIADRTNLLALNAAIESARAGEQGRGFAVVADEVRTLAQRTRESTTEIRQMIEDLHAGTNDAVSVMKQARNQADQVLDVAGRTQEAIKAIGASVTQIAEFSTNIATSTERQTSVAHDVECNIVSIGDIATGAASGAEETVAANNQLINVVVDLKQLVGQFKV